MLTLPPKPPKDYRLEDVSLSQASAPEMTPSALPRATQPSIGKYCVPIPDDDNEPADKSQITELNKRILEKLMYKAKAEWVDRPGLNDFYVHDVCKKYSVQVEPERDVRFQHKFRVFQRSYKYEFDCMENARLKKLASKMAQEEKEDQDMLSAVKGKQEVKDLVDTCKKQPPFWWRQPVDEEEATNFMQNQAKPTESVYQSSYLRWQPVPSIADVGEHDSCKRRDAFAHVNLDKCLCRDIGDVAGDTCVSVQFLDNPPLDICEDDFTPKRKYSRDSNNVKSGKSCLFSLTPAQAEEAIYQFDVYVRVCKKMKAGVMPEKIQVGNSLISIVNLFNELISSVNLPTNESSPTAKTLKDVFQISNTCGQIVGDIGMYIRMSCFGKLIVTQFQMNLDDKSVLFKDKEGHSLYRYKKAGKGDVQESRTPSCPKAHCGSGSVSQMRSPTMSSTNNVPPPTPINFSGQCVCGQESALSTIAENDKRCYQEIGAAMGGNALTIRVHKEKKLEQVDNEEELCTCTPSYQTNKMPRASGGGCQQQDQSVVMRPGVDDGSNGNAPFSFKLGGCSSGKGNNVTVIPPVCSTNDGTQYTELSDPTKDVFILRIGKKCEGSEKKKNNLELELCTPKGPDIKPPPRKETRDTQWCDEDAGKGKSSRGSRGSGDRGGGAVTHFIGERRPCIPCTPCFPCPMPQYTYCAPTPPCSYEYSCRPPSYCKPVSSSCRYWC
ncbi:hypothetical protein RN001_009747 [Aquatica leii]|uniref:Uncharacterized protein n=1 Tax=Aquatica leii TaxID=1421715 RepID=A0AAN7P8D7_9COLE|nr:hypothetical protein RN001_009747 [Aquatica leii]